MELPKQLFNPIKFLDRLSNLVLNEDGLKGWQIITEEFELYSLSPLFKPVAQQLAEKISHRLKFLCDKKKSEFIFPKYKNHITIEEGDLIEYFDEQTGNYSLRPELRIHEESIPISDDEISRIWQDFHLMLNRFINICKTFGYEIESNIDERCIQLFVQLEIINTPFIEFGSREILQKALRGEINESEFNTLKIEIKTTLGEAAYIFNRIKTSGKLPLISKLINAGAFWKNRVLSWESMKKEKSNYKKNDKKILNRTEIDEKIDTILAII
jgi:hypothetical protein